MHLLLVGPGALGCLLSTVISKGLDSDARLTILDYNADRANYLTTHGIVYQHGEAKMLMPVTAVSDPHLLCDVDVVLLCVKSYHIDDSLRFCEQLLTERTLIIFLQNGISHLTLASPLSRASTAFGTTTEGATLLSMGHVYHAGSGTTFLGFREPPSGRFAELLRKTHAIFAAGGLQVETVEDIVARLWMKLFINVGINALSACFDCRNGDLLTLPGASSRMQTAVDEAAAVGRAHNIPVPDDLFRAVQAVCAKTAQNISSMLQDVRNKRRTEIDAINGAIVTLGERLHIDTPENRLLCRQIKALEISYGVK